MAPFFFILHSTNTPSTKKNPTKTNSKTKEKWSIKKKIYIPIKYKKPALKPNYNWKQKSNQNKNYDENYILYSIYTIYALYKTIVILLNTQILSKSALSTHYVVRLCIRAALRIVGHGRTGSQFPND